MKISELIECLNRLQDEYGDLNVFINNQAFLQQTLQSLLTGNPLLDINIISQATATTEDGKEMEIILIS